MTTRERTILIFIILLNLAVILIRVLFYYGLDSFKSELDDYEIAATAKFEKQLSAKLISLQSSNKNIYNAFNSKFDRSKAVIEIDTTFNLLYLRENVKIKTPIPGYLECFEEKCLIELKNDLVQKEIELRSQTLKMKYGDSFNIWFSQLKENRLFNMENKLNDACNKALGEQIFEITIDKKKWKDFEVFLGSYYKEIKSLEYENKKILNELGRMENSIKSQLNNNASQYFSNSLESEKNSIIQSESVSKTYKSEGLGSIDYTIEKISINRDRFQKIADNALEVQWKTNSLSNGSMPYSYCYGSSNYCNDYGCSQIQVKSGSSDVLVTIKTMSGRVYRHGYIKAGRSFTFNVADGSYQVFFYSGMGWNPNKYIKQANCGKLNGGFVSNESVTKDSYLTLYSQIMSYELISQQGGNFSAEQSSKNEAF